MDDSRDWEEDSGDFLKMVGRQVKLWREQAKLTQPELGQRIGYGDELVSSVERGRRAPKPEFLDNADEVLGANGLLKAFKDDVERTRFPRKVRDLAKLEASAVTLGAYCDHNIQGLLQTEDYARALYQMRRPLLNEETVERYVAARMARQEIFTRWPAPILSFVQEEVTLRRPLGGRAVMRGQLERLLELGRLRNVEIQVMPTDREDHAGMGGEFLLLNPKNGPTVGRVEVLGFSRVITNRDEVRTLEAQYGIIRAQALTPRESLAFIEKVLGET
ncbi:helix-turn-helix domain-containing protein [Streptomyces sp. PRB2-1]|uniref:Helix-turn-helix domain-containing protein n=2 Tax=Actinacidiphila epipremni TaxID=2053013 RepID=A0ABX0ZGA4_9ACTN|nr:helix-turn-helix transcriptional regulator [Actinacidiphila epipremni]NJP42152.1 helix-turn-helix domain-containing protein [Actinacidiphila epipremni]